MKKKIVIVGGGIAGLTAGIYAQKYGFESTIYEKHTIVGGQCTGWDRNGYHIDNCIDWLTGSAKGSDLNDMWREVGALGDNIELIKRPYYGMYELDGITITLWRDYGKLRAELKRISPEDRVLIDELVDDIKTAGNMEMPAKKPIDMLKLPELMKLGMACKDAGAIMKKYSAITCEEYGKKYQHPALQKLFTYCMPSGYSMSSFVFSMATVCKGDGAVPRGGSRAMALRIADTYRALGGKIVTGMGVDEIILEGLDTRKAYATGVKLADGTEVQADYVIAACDVYYTFKKLLHDNFHDKEFEMRFADTQNYSLPTSAHTAFAVDMDMKDYPLAFTYETKPFTVGETTLDAIGFHNYSYEPDFAPEGHSVVVTFMEQSDDDFLWWEECYKDADKYRAEKERISRLCQERIEMRFPELVGKITPLDTYTPMTYHRYCSSYHGAWMSFNMTPTAKTLSHKGIIKGLRNCFLAGMYTQSPGGLPVALTSGKFAVQRICKLEGMSV